MRNPRLVVEVEVRHGESADDGDTNGGITRRRRSGTSSMTIVAPIHPPRASGSAPAARPTPLWSRSGKGRDVGEGGGAVDGLGEVLAGALDHRGDCRAGGSGVEDTDIGGVVQHEGAVDLAVFYGASCLLGRREGVDRKSCCHFLDLSELLRCCDNSEGGRCGARILLTAARRR